MRSRIFFSSSALLLAAGCVLRLGSGAELASPGGSHVTLEMDGGAPIAGELLEARDSALVVLADNHVMLVRMAGVGTLQVPRARFRVNRRPLLGELLRDLQLESRFPQGIPDPLMARLLEVARQPALVVRD